MGSHYMMFLLQNYFYCKKKQKQKKILYKLEFETKWDDQVRVIRFSPTGEYLAIAGLDKKVIIYDSSTPRFSIVQIIERESAIG